MSQTKCMLLILHMKKTFLIDRSSRKQSDNCDSILKAETGNKGEKQLMTSAECSFMLLEIPLIPF